MSAYHKLNDRVRELVKDRFKDFEQEVIHGKTQAERSVEYQKKREKHRREILASVGTDLKKLDAAMESEGRMQEAELKRFLEEFRPKALNRRPTAASDAADAAIHSAVLAESGHKVLPVFASSIFTPDRNAIDGDLDWNNGAINSGWVFPDDPSKIRIKDNYHDLSLCWPNRWGPPPEFAVHFTFVPATTATYELVAVLAFHGFYLLVADDGYFSCRFAQVKLTAQMNVHQYVNAGWKSFPPLLDLKKEHAQEVTNFDRTFFFDYTAALRAGDPVVITVKGVVEAFSHGGYTHAELNFYDGTANYIQPLFLSVQQV
ncbi:MAG TPA: hypothetical protein VFV10_12280 [Gammaproteobacteria bacterium]|nr:hypothetical protein [Gammaproteobacteria bacterium]